jgi:hypothetical protein
MKVPTVYRWKVREYTGPRCKCGKGIGHLKKKGYLYCSSNCAPTGLTLKGTPKVFANICQICRGPATRGLVYCSRNCAPHGVYLNGKEKLGPLNPLPRIEEEFLKLRDQNNRLKDQNRALKFRVESLMIDVEMWKRVKK